MYAAVWTTAMCRLAPRYGLSDAGLAKLCRREAIPVPPRGHWAKVRAGKKVERPPLPPAPKRGPRSRGVETLGARPPDVQEKPEAFFSPDVAALIAHLAESPGIVIRDDVRGAHAVVRGEAQRLHRNWSQPQDSWAKVGNGWRNARYALDISKEHERRTVGLLDALVRQAAACGAAFGHGDHRGACVVGTIFSCSFRLWVNELLRRDPVDPTSTDAGRARWSYVHSGRLQIGFDLHRYSGGRVWTDGTRSLEEQLVDVLPAILRAIDADLRNRDEIAREQRDHEERARRQAADDARRREETERRQKLLSEAMRWREVAITRDYVDAVARRVHEADPANQDSLTAWVERARSTLNEMDPFPRRIRRSTGP